MLKTKPRMLICSSPSHYSGPAISEKEFRQVLASIMSEALICFDEAYVEVVESSNRFSDLVILKDSGKPFIVLRTFSKAYGLAGVRVGFGIMTEPALITSLMKTRTPIGVSAMAA